MLFELFTNKECYKCRRYEKPLRKCYIEWRDCEIYVIKDSIMSHNVIKKARLALYVKKAVGLKVNFIGFQTTYYHADTVPQNVNKHIMINISKISINIDNPKSEIATLTVKSYNHTVDM